MARNESAPPRPETNFTWPAAMRILVALNYGPRKPFVWRELGADGRVWARLSTVGRFANYCQCNPRGLKKTLEWLQANGWIGHLDRASKPWRIELLPPQAHAAVAADDPRAALLLETSEI